MNKRSTAQFLLSIFTPILVIILIAVFTNSSQSFYFPPFNDVLQALFSNWFSERMTSDVLPSVNRVVISFMLSIIVGVGLGILLGMSSKTRVAFEPIIEFIRAIPSPALIPLAVIFLGFGDDMKIFIITLVCIFPILLNTLDGVVGIETPMVETAQIYRINKTRYVTEVVVPSALPQIFAGMRTSLALALVMMVVTEMVGADGGIGFTVLLAARSYEITDMWSGIIILGMLGLVFNAILVAVESKVLRWHRGVRGQHIN